MSCRPRVAVLVFWYHTSMADTNASADDLSKEKKRVTEKIVTTLRCLLQESEQYAGTFTQDSYDALSTTYPDPEHKRRFATSTDQLLLKLVATFGLSPPPEKLKVPVHKRPRPSVHRHTHTFTHSHRHTDTQSHRHTDTRTHRNTDSKTQTKTQTKTPAMQT